MKRILWLFSLLLDMAMISGCGLHMYDAQKNAIAKEARNSFVEANLPDLAKQEYTLNQQTLEQQLVVVRKHAFASRDAIIVEALDRQEDACGASAGPPDCKHGDRRTKGNLSWGFLERKIKQRLDDELGVKSTKSARYLFELMNDIETYEARIMEVEAGLKSSDNPGFKVAMTATLDRMKQQQDERAKKLELGLNAQFDSQKQFRQLLEEITEIENQRKTINEKSQSEKAKYDAIKADYDKALLAQKSNLETDELVGILQAAEQVLSSYDVLQAAPEEHKIAMQNLYNDAVSYLKGAATAAKSKSNKKIADELAALTDKLDTKKAIFQKTINDNYEEAAKKGNITAFGKRVSSYLKYGTQVINTDKIKGINLQALKDLYAAADLPKLRTQMDAVNQLVNVYLKNNGAAPSTVDVPSNTAVHVAQSLRAIADHYGKANTFPHASSLLLESERLRIEYEATKQRLERGQIHLALLRDKLKTMMQEIHYLSLAQDHLMVATAKIRPASEGDWEHHLTSLIDDFLSSNDQGFKVLVGKMMYFYAAAWTLGRTPEEEIDYRIIALNHDSALDSAVVALQQWNNLILVPLTGIAAFHESGVTTDDIAKFLQAAGVGAIAGGVNR
jgi:hypothetical protein